jgi:hypothetical protein
VQATNPSRRCHRPAAGAANERDQDLDRDHADNRLQHVRPSQDDKERAATANLNHPLPHPDRRDRKSRCSQPCSERLDLNRRLHAPGHGRPAHIAFTTAGTVDPDVLQPGWRPSWNPRIGTRARFESKHCTSLCNYARRVGAVGALPKDTQVPAAGYLAIAETLDSVGTRAHDERVPTGQRRLWGWRDSSKIPAACCLAIATDEMRCF